MNINIILYKYDTETQVYLNVIVLRKQKLNSE